MMMYLCTCIKTVPMIPNGKISRVLLQMNIFTQSQVCVFKIIFIFWLDYTIHTFLEWKLIILMPLENAHISMTHTNVGCQISFSINQISLDKVQIMQLIDGFWPLWYLSLDKYLSCLWPDQYRSDRQNHTWTCLNKKQPWKHDRPLFYISLSNEIVKHWSVCCHIL